MVFLKAILGQPDMLRTFFGSLLNSLAPWKCKELKRRLENLVFLRGLVWIVLPKPECTDDWTFIRFSSSDCMFGTKFSRIDHKHINW